MSGDDKCCWQFFFFLFAFISLALLHDRSEYEVWKYVKPKVSEFRIYANCSLCIQICALRGLAFPSVCCHNFFLNHSHNIQAHLVNDEREKRPQTTKMTPKFIPHFLFLFVFADRTLHNSSSLYSSEKWNIAGTGHCYTNTLYLLLGCNE